MRNRRRAPHEQRPGRAWADLPLRAKGLVVVAIPLLALLLATVLFGVALAQDRRAQDAVLHSVEVERQIAHVRIQVQAGVTGYVLTGERRYLTSYETARRELPEAVGQLGGLVSDNPGQVDRVERVRALIDERADLLEALVANVQANRPPASRAELLDQNKVSGDALVAQLQAMQDTDQRLLSVRQAEARRARTLALGAIGLSVLLGIAGGIAAVLLFTSGVTRRAARLEQNADRLAGGLPLLPALPDGDALGELGRGLERAAVLLGERERALREAQALLEHIVAWSPMVMFRGCWAAAASATSAAMSSGCSATPRSRCWGLPASGPTSSTPRTASTSPPCWSGPSSSGLRSLSRSTGSCSRTATAGCTASPGWPTTTTAPWPTPSATPWTSPSASRPTTPSGSGRPLSRP
jgi:CHASE3 domain sensor protein